MPHLYLYKCYAQPHVIERFKEFYKSEYHLAQFCNNLLISMDAKFSDDISECVSVERRENPYFSTVLKERLTGNISHMLSFMNIECIEIESTEKIMEHFENKK